MYEKGWGVTLDYDKAVELYQKAADQGYYLGQSNLGFMYQEGLGVDQDDEKAIEWYQKSLDQEFQQWVQDGLNKLTRT